MVFTKASLIEHAAKYPDRTFILINEKVFDVSEFLEEVCTAVDFFYRQQE